MTPAARTDAGHLTGLWNDVVHDRIAMGRVAAHATWHVIEIQIVTRTVRDIVIRA